MPRLNSIPSIDNKVIGNHRIRGLCKKTARLMPAWAAIIRRDIRNYVPDHVIVGDAAVVITTTGFDGGPAIGVTRRDQIVDVVSYRLVKTRSSTYEGEDNAVCVASCYVKILDSRIATAQANRRCAVSLTGSHQFRLPLILGFVSNWIVDSATRIEGDIPPICPIEHDNCVARTDNFVCVLDCGPRAVEAAIAIVISGRTYITQSTRWCAHRNRSRKG